MINQQMPNLSGTGALTDTLDFVKNLWGSMGVPGMNVPGMAMPTLSVEDLDKKIEDLKAVESWLNVNMSMLRGTIQTLEVQRGTIATLKSMSAAMGAAMNSAETPASSSPAPNPYMAAFAFPPSAAKKAEPASIQPAPVAAPTPVQPTSTTAEPAKKPETDEAAANAPMMNPAAWWGVLQEQFKQAVSTAMAADVALKKGLAAATDLPKTDLTGKKADVKVGGTATKNAAKSPVTESAAKTKTPVAKRKPAA
ncbi:MAG: PhaM family polyhydroxyalkanoate granule multifunctional regulatory protein [Pseudomonadota bacterium]